MFILANAQEIHQAIRLIQPILDINGYYDRQKAWKLSGLVDYDGNWWKEMVPPDMVFPGDNVGNHFEQALNFGPRSEGGEDARIGCSKSYRLSDFLGPPSSFCQKSKNFLNLIHANKPVDNFFVRLGNGLKEIIGVTGLYDDNHGGFRTIVLDRDLFYKNKEPKKVNGFDSMILHECQHAVDVAQGKYEKTDSMGNPRIVL